ncbi:prepilin peptidase [candidate division CSSED10-310 bacterium]|uniref:Prepilin peptidase n=1 Tax=candidate division CSSED10-310 bacterium TaxID=2855610 RepID=A0ABV6YTW2_UNCC1
MVALYVLVLVVLICAITDLQKQKIYNFITFPAIIAGLGLGLAFNGVQGLVNSLVGMLIGFTIFLMMHILGQMGAGDVKLMAAVGALGGFPFILYALFLSVVCGGIISLLVAIWQGRLLKSFSNIFRALFSTVMPGVTRQPLSEKNSTQIPYACAVCLGSIGAVLESVFRIFT